MSVEYHNILQTFCETFKFISDGLNVSGVSITIKLVWSSKLNFLPTLVKLVLPTGVKIFRKNYI